MIIGVLVEHDGRSIKEATRRAITAAQSLGGEVIALVAGDGIVSVAEEAALCDGVSGVWVSDHPVYAHGLAEAIAPWLKTCVEAHGVTYLVAPGSSFGRNVLPRAAALIGMAPIESVIAIHADKRYTRAMYAGNVLCDVTSKEAVQCLTVASTAFQSCVSKPEAAPIRSHDYAAEQSLSTWESLSKASTDTADLATASMVMSIGRGVLEPQIDRIKSLAQHYGAALGASRAVVDAGLMPNECQVGQTGQSVAPDLYVAWGISGAIQHVAGMKESRVVVSINTDPNAPMKEIADYTLEADVEDILSSWERAVVS